MGRIKTALIKRVTKKLIKEHGQEFKEDFNLNKAVVERFAIVQSKKLRNIIAGYATRIVKRQEA